MKKSPGPSVAPRVCGACIRAHMEFLASDAMRGRGSGTADELLAATYVGSQLRAYGVAPAGDNGSYVQRAVLQQPKLSAPPLLMFTRPSPGNSEEKVTWTCGKEFIVRYLSQTHFSGPLRVDRPGEDSARVAGAIVLILDKGSDRKKFRAHVKSLVSAGAVAAIEVASAEEAERFQEKGKELPALPMQIEGQRSRPERQFQSAAGQSGCGENT